MSDASRTGRASGAALAAVIPLRAPDRGERPSLTLVPARVRRHRTAVITVAALLAMFAVMFGLAALQTMIAQGQAKLDRLSSQVHGAEDTYAKLRLEVAQLESPSRIVSAAEKRLGMVTPSTVNYLAPNGGEALAVRQGAAAAGLSTATPRPAGESPSGSATDGWLQVKPYVGTNP